LVKIAQTPEKSNDKSSRKIVELRLSMTKFQEKSRKTREQLEFKIKEIRRVKDTEIAGLGERILILDAALARKDKRLESLLKELETLKVSFKKLSSSNGSEN